MKVNMLCVEDGISAVGFRKVVSMARSVHDNIGVYYIGFESNYSLKQFLTGKHGTTDQRYYDESNIRAISETLADADIVAFSAMTHLADYTHLIIKEVRRLNPKVFLLWGKSHLCGKIKSY